MIFDIIENGKKDKIIITSEGKIFSDEIEIKVETVETDQIIVKDVQPMSTSYNTMDCPRGNPSDYTEYYMTENKSNIELSKKSSEYTGLGLSILLAGLTGTVFLGSISFAIADVLINDFGNVEPDTYGLSFKATIYSHKDGPYYGTIYRKYNTKWYSQINYGGSITNTVSYRVTEYY
ncbi:hypothetical protein [Sedimentibacter sp. MB31-C6]|uniref:hypothetical protein n=1 Tax=Sedimentibacter sp. MB31-C6 TaxID=3109366 RepID=UPI002DDCE49D|nr:hypothetical protein [Sedimentibacter sp. MB36-C1]WSI02851.1 hypothetical protein U8307_07290 [Sedimentibacter sp. MB36-C1]